MNNSNTETNAEMTYKEAEESLQISSAKDQYTALVETIKSKSDDKVILDLIENTPEEAINFVDIDQRTVLMYACNNKMSFAVIEALLKAGAHKTVNVKSRAMGDSALSWAVYKKAPANIIQALVDAGADVNNISQYDNTPVIQSVFRQANRPPCQDTLRILLEAGADLSLINDKEIQNKKINEIRLEAMQKTMLNAYRVTIEGTPIPQIIKDYIEMEEPPLEEFNFPKDRLCTIS